MTSTAPGTLHGSGTGASNAYAAMRERVPELTVGLDAWTRRMMRWHFSPETGSPFWLTRRGSLGFDPLKDVDGFAALQLFGLFDKAELRAAHARELLPRGYHDRPFRIFETGGTTGTPCRIVNVTRLAYDVEIYRTMLEARGVAGGDILAMTPMGPHAYGHFVEALADSWHGAVHAIDFDPRWVKAALRAGAEADTYTEHLIAQTLPLLTGERPELLFTTSRLLVELAMRLPRPLHTYGVRAVCTGGTSCTPAEAQFLREEHLVDVQWIDTYGNTLVGHALQGDAVPGTTELPEGITHTYHLPPPFAVMTVVDPHDPWRELAVGERGRVRVTTLLEDLFIPNLLERDSAVRTGPHPWFPWDGVAAVRPFEQNAEDTVEGVY
jgi:phenylacetate-coenzyme A ligase PaaK-like adenylate-forming protein